jgi:hypothetical protein
MNVGTQNQDQIGTKTMIRPINGLSAVAGYTHCENGRNDALGYIGFTQRVEMRSGS